MPCCWIRAWFASCHEFEITWEQSFNISKDVLVVLDKHFNSGQDNNTGNTEADGPDNAKKSHEESRKAAEVIRAAGYAFISTFGIHHAQLSITEKMPLLP